MKRMLCCALLLTLALGGVPDARGEANETWTAGYGEAEIPYDAQSKPACYIAGYRQGIEITGVLDLQKVKAFYISDGERSILFLAVDCVGLDSGSVAILRARVRNALPETCVVHVYATHTHAGADTLGLWGPTGKTGKRAPYMEALYGAAEIAAQIAYADRRTGELFRGSAETTGMQRDSRAPQSYDPTLTVLRFSPDDKSAGIRWIQFAAHAEALRSRNTLMSADYPAYLAEAVTEATGDRALFAAGAIGGLIMTPQFKDDVVDNVRYTGRRLAETALSIDNEVHLSARLYSDTERIEIPCRNTAFAAMRLLGVMSHQIVGQVDGVMALGTEVSYVRLGEAQLLLVPGELFPELALGDAYGCATDADNPMPLNELFGDDLLIVGLANDEIGYIVPPSDFLLQKNAPYFSQAEGHYEETNSVGPDAATIIAQAAKTLLVRATGASE